jgi:hypothetical protein
MVAGGTMACGCSDSAAGRVAGSVKLDGKPVADAEVRFCPAENPNLAGNSARTGSDGTFELERHANTGKTLAAGHYVVLVSKMVQKGGAAPPAEDAGMLLASGAVHNGLPAMYDEFDKSPFKVEISKGDNILRPFELRSK